MKSWKKNKGFITLYIIYIILLLGDIITTLLNGELIKILEVNPLYKHVGLPGIISLNIFIALLIYWIYNKKTTSPTTRFFFTNIMTVIIVARIWAIHNAITWLRQPTTIETAKAIATPAAKTATLQALMYIQYAPLIIAIISYLFWKWDHEIKRKDS